MAEAINGRRRNIHPTGVRGLGSLCPQDFLPLNSPHGRAGAGYYAHKSQERPLFIPRVCGGWAGAAAGGNAAGIHPTGVWGLGYLTGVCGLGLSMIGLD